MLLESYTHTRVYSSFLSITCGCPSVYLMFCSSLLLFSHIHLASYTSLLMPSDQLHIAHISYTNTETCTSNAQVICNIGTLHTSMYSRSRSHSRSRSRSHPYLATPHAQQHTLCYIRRESSYCTPY